MSLLKNVSRAPRKVMPVIILADVSGSMSVDGKIQALNASIREMLRSFAADESPHSEIQVCVITFGNEARIHCPLQAAAAIKWQDMRAQGMTPMGAAMTLASDLIEDRKSVPRNAWRPTVILVSDGYPNDDWQAPMQALTAEGRSRKADRMALAIGDDADEAMLQRFLADPERQVFRAEDAAGIHQFFRYATMSMTVRSLQANANQIPSAESVAKHYSLPDLTDPFSKSF